HIPQRLRLERASLHRSRGPERGREETGGRLREWQRPYLPAGWQFALPALRQSTRRRSLSNCAEAAPPVLAQRSGENLPIANIVLDQAGIEAEEAIFIRLPANRLSPDRVSPCHPARSGSRGRRNPTILP